MRKDIVTVKICREANKEHADSRRQYAHVFHKRNVICVAREFHFIPDTHRLAILLHEVGHLLVGQKGTEAQASRRAAVESGVPIAYKDSAYGDQLEWIPPEYKQKAREFLGIESKRVKK